MLKTIPISELTTDMFIAELIESPGAQLPKKKRGMVRDPRIIAKFIEIGIQQVVIDLERGLDVQDVSKTQDDRPTGKVMSNQQIEDSLQLLRQNLGTSYHELKLEWGTAKQIFRTSISIVNHSLEAARHGDSINGRYFEEAAQAISRSIIRNKDALTWLGKIRDQRSYLFEHSVNTSVLMGIFANALGLSLSETEQCITAGLLHDLGQAHIEEEFFQRPGPLSESEFETVKKHVDFGLDIIKASPQSSEVIQNIILQHHERFDGTGYPAGLAGKNISLHGRMFAIVDTYDAVTNNRNYKSATPSSAGMRTLLELSGKHFDQSLVHQFIKCMGVYPTGSLVKLSNGLLAVVIAQKPGHPLKPLVRTIFNSKSFAYVEPRMMDLMSPQHNEKIISYEDPGKYDIVVNDFLPEEMSL